MYGALVTLEDNLFGPEKKSQKSKVILTVDQITIFSSTCGKQA